MKMISIDTSKREQIQVSLTVDEQIYAKTEIGASRKNQAVLPLIVALLKEHEITLNNIEAISVATGPGSFTGLRVGVAIANALSYTLNIPVNGKTFIKDTSLIEPTYSV